MDKETRKAYNKAYYEANKEKIKAYTVANKEKRKAYFKAYNEANKETRKAYNKAYNEANKEKIKAYMVANKEKRKACFKAYREINKERIYKRRKDCPILWTKHIIRSRMNCALRVKGFSRSKSMSQYLGCSVDFLKSYLQARFTEGMTWDNMGEWHIDHLVPLNLATSVEELYALSHYRNLKPAWAKDNLSKGDRLLPEHKLLADQLLNGWI